MTKAIHSGTTTRPVCRPYENPYEEGSVAAAPGAEGAGDEWQQAEDENGIPA